MSAEKKICPGVTSGQGGDDMRTMNVLGCTGNGRDEPPPPPPKPTD